ncbi:MAG: hypothetical protein KF745_04935 [Phycisphaeraceae bacterium]|nr:hypothetical protein [Phycisphaeraceae bacterium]
MQPRRTAPRRWPRIATRLLLSAAAAACSACITVPAPKPSDQPSPTLPTASAARPAPIDSTRTSRLTFAIKPLGRVRYDGLSQPLVSPAGDHIALQQGRPPTWPSILAQPGSPPPLGSEIAVVDITDTGLAPRTLTAPLPAGLLLGRSADQDGFLVEAPQGDGSRWIGKVAWKTGAVDWLVRDKNVSAHAVLGPAGELAYTRRANPRAPASLVVIPSPGQPALELAPGGTDLAFPTFGDIPGVLAVFAIAPDGIEVLAVATDPASGSLLPGPRTWLASSGGMIDAYQSIASSQTPVVLPRGGLPSGLIPLFHPAQHQIVAFSPSDGSLLSLAPNSFAAAWMGEASGAFLVGTPKGVVSAQPTPDTTGRQAVPVVSMASIPRATTTRGSFLLIGPAEGDAYAYEIVAVALQKP